MRDQPARDELLTPGGVAALLYVDPKTVTRWANTGKLPAIRTPGGHRRVRSSDLRSFLRSSSSWAAWLTELPGTMHSVDLACLATTVPHRAPLLTSHFSRLPHEN